MEVSMYAGPTAPAARRFRRLSRQAPPGPGSFWIPRDPLEAHAQERGDVYRRAYHRVDEVQGRHQYGSRSPT